VSLYISPRCSPHPPCRMSIGSTASTERRSNCRCCDAEWTNWMVCNHCPGHVCPMWFCIHAVMCICVCVHLCSVCAVSLYFPSLSMDRCLRRQIVAVLLHWRICFDGRLLRLAMFHPAFLAKCHLVRILADAFGWCFGLGISASVSYFSDVSGWQPCCQEHYSML